jgi:hypothetical protein
MDNGYFVTRARPREGMRLVWLPKDEDDLNFSDTNFKILDTNAAVDSLYGLSDMNQANGMLAV